MFKARTTNESTFALDVFADEEWFNKMTIGGYICLPDNIRIDQAADFRRYESHIPKRMHFTATSMPKKQSSFDGLLFFEPLLHEVKAKQSSVNRKSGSTYLQSVTMDRTKFNGAIIKVLKETVQELPDATNIRIMADGARVHSVKKTDEKV